MSKKRKIACLLVVFAAILCTIGGFASSTSPFIDDEQVPMSGGTYTASFYIDTQFVGSTNVPYFLCTYVGSGTITSTKSIGYNAASVSKIVKSAPDCSSYVNADQTVEWVSSYSAFGGYRIIGEVVDKPAMDTTTVNDTDATEFSNVTVMRKANLKDGTTVTTLGYREKGDGGAATYTITSDKMTSNGSTVLSLNNGNYAILKVSKGTVIAEQFGAYGDGIHDDSTAINNILNNKYYKTIQFTKGHTYKCNSPIEMNVADRTIKGNNVTLFTDNKYNGDTEWFFSIRADNTTIKNLKIRANETNRQTYKTQLGLIKCSNVTISGCSFDIPSTVCTTNTEGYSKEYTSIDLYSGWHNVTIDNCSINNESGCLAGSCIWIRDIYKIGASGLSFTNNTLNKNTHDEIIAVYYGSVEDVNIYNNTITSTEDGISNPTNHVIMVGSTDSTKCSNIVFDSNTFNVESANFLGKIGTSEGFKFINNDVTYTKLTDSTFILFEKKTSTEPGEGIYDNNVFTINSSVKISKVFNVPAQVSNNRFILNGCEIETTYGVKGCRNLGNNILVSGTTTSELNK